MATIFISIAAYRDPELVPTIEDCLAKASYPERLRFGICWQHGPEESRLPYAGDARFQILDVDWRESRGACWARAEVMALYRGEDWFFQIDSHHRFVSGWDELLIAQAALTGSAKPVLTTYGTSFTPGKPDSFGAEPLQLNFDRFTPDGVVLFHPAPVHDWATRRTPARARFVSAHYLFAPGSFVADVPYDPELYFHGEEITLSIRAFTHGYDLFHPAVLVMWHEYSRDYRPHKHWGDHIRANDIPVEWQQRDRSSLDKVRSFVEQPWVGPFGCGTVRTFAEYEEYAGLHFRLRRVQDFTRLGLEPPNPVRDPGWAERMQRYSIDLTIDRAQLPSEVGDSRLWFVGFHDESRREIFRRDMEPDEIRAALAAPGAEISIHREFDSESEPAWWIVWPNSESGGWLTKLEGRVAPHVEPATFVTALLDIGRDALEPPFTRSFAAHYLPQFVRLLKIQAPLVVYVQPEYENLVWRHRRRDNTRVVTVTRAELEAQPWFGAVDQIRQRPAWRAQAPWLAGSPQAALPHYAPLVLSKMRWLADVARENPFGTQDAFWIDAGLCHTVPAETLGAAAFARRVTEAAGDFAWIGFPYADTTEIHGFPREALTRLAGRDAVDHVIRGGFFGGRTATVADVAARYDVLLRTTLASGWMGTEESLFTILACQSPERYRRFMVGGDGLIAPFFHALAEGREETLLRAPDPAPLRAAEEQGAVPATLAAPIAADELAVGLIRYMGLPMMQNRQTPAALDALWQHLERSGQRVARIVEIGTGQGGLSVLLQVYCLGAGASFVTYDRWPSAQHAAFERLGIEQRLADVTEPDVVASIACELQQDGLTILVCDGASKKFEVNTYSDYLKPGDVLLAHDYAPTPDDFDRDLKGRGWNWLELTDADIAEARARNKLEPLLPEAFLPGAWLCAIKRGAGVPAPAPGPAAESVAVYVLTYNAPAQFERWLQSVAEHEPALLACAEKVLLDNSTDEATREAYDRLCARYGFRPHRHGNLGITGGRLWCARHFEHDSAADLMAYFEDDMLIRGDAAPCRNGLPGRVPDVVRKALAVLRQEPELDYLKLSYTEFHGDHREDWSWYNLDPARRAQFFPAGNGTRVHAVRTADGVAYMVGEIFYSNWPLLMRRRGNRLLFLEGDAGAGESALMVRALELQRAGTLRTAVLLASPIQHDRSVHYPAQARVENALPSRRDTIVTAVYDLDCDDLIGGRSRSVDTYLPSLASVANLGAALVIYTRPAHVERLTAFCRELGVPARVVGRPIEETPRFARIQQLRVEQEYHTKPWRDRCHVLCLAKMPWLAEQARANPFGSARFYWLDAGIAYDALFPSRHLASNDARCALFVPAVLDRLAPFRRVLAGQHPILTTHIHQVPIEAHAPFLGPAAAAIRTHVVGGLFGGSREAIAWMAAEYDDVLEGLLGAGLLGTEENVLTVLYHRQPSASTLLAFTTWYHEETAGRTPQPDDVPFYRLFEPDYHQTLSSLNQYQFD